MSTFNIPSLPNFLIIGAQKAGTSALYYALRQHPQIFMSSIKEPGYFTFVNHSGHFEGPLLPQDRFKNLIDWPTYLAMFARATAQPARGEASTFYSYCWTEQTAAHIHRCLPHVRLIAILRQPAERAYSAFNMMREHRLEPLADFSRALAAETSVERARWTPDFRYFQNGLYYANLKPYFEHFPRSQIRIYLYEDWNSRPEEVLRDICRYLDVEEFFTPTMAERRHTTLISRSNTLRLWLKQPHPIKNLGRPLLPYRWRRWLAARLWAWNQFRPPPLDPALRRQLTESYREDILRLQELIGRDLSGWLHQNTEGGIPDSSGEKTV